jgi:hypothetical protein
LDVAPRRSYSFAKTENSLFTLSETEGKSVQRTLKNIGVENGLTGQSQRA